MTESPDLTVLVVGATGSIGRHVVDELLRRGHKPRALARDPEAAEATLPPGAEITVGDLTDIATLNKAVSGIGAVVFTHGSHGGPGEAEAVDYNGVRNTLIALGDQPACVALMTAIGVTNHDGAYNRATQAHDWKRRAERLVRASRRSYTIVRPGWFDYNAPDQLRLVMLQGDRRHVGDPSDGVVSRRQVAQVLVAALTTAAADHKTLELVAEHGPAHTDLAPLFADLKADLPDALDGVLDAPGLPTAHEPDRVRQELEALRHQ